MLTIVRRRSPRSPGVSPLAVLLFVACVACLGAVSAPVQDAAAAGKPRIAVRDISVTRAVLTQATADGQVNVLEQIAQGTDPQLVNALSAGGRFDVVARADLPAVLREQSLSASGNVDTLDPQTAKQLQLAGARYLATVSIENFQDVVERTVLKGQFGDSNAERRTIQMQGSVRIFDTTSGVLLRATSVALNEAAVDEILGGVAQTGRKTNALIGKVTALFATTASRAISESLMPARVVGYTMGQITFNRTKESGVEVGQVWEVLAPGAEMVDPETGQPLGSEEVHIGWARVTDAGSRFSTAQAIEDLGIDRGSIMRARPQGLPAGVDPNGRATGSASGSASAAPSAQPMGEAPASADSKPARLSPADSGSGTASSGATAAPARKVAIFVKQRPACLPEDKVSVFEDDIAASLATSQFELIRREDVMNAVNRFAASGPNEGTAPPASQLFDRLQSDRASATALAALMGADYLLTAAITTYDKTERAFDDPTINTKTLVREWNLRATYSILDGTNGGSIASGTAPARLAVRDTPEVATTLDTINPLLMDAASQIGAALSAAVSANKLRQAAEGSAEVDVQINAVLADLSVPDAVRGANGDYTIVPNLYKLEPMNVSVMVDGVVVGQTPGTIRVRPGLHRLRLERPGLEPVDRMMNVKAGLALSIPMQFSPEGRANWERNAVFFNELKNGAVLREAEIIKVKAVAEFLKNSNIRLDTSNVQNLNLGGQSIWWQLLGP
jgi:curli biogenesis system outer membrane secretion channel CsgG